MRRLLGLQFGDCQAVDLRWGGFPVDGEEEERESFQLCIQKWMVDSITMAVVHRGEFNGDPEVVELEKVELGGLFVISSPLSED